MTKAGMFDFQQDRSQAEEWVRVRNQMREENRKRVAAGLEPYRIPLKDAKGNIIGWKDTGFCVNKETHAMDADPDSFFEHLLAPVKAALDAELAEHARNTQNFTSVEIPENLPHTDYDGPPINDLTNEQEIFDAVDKMIALGTPKDAETKQVCKAPDKEPDS